MLKVGLTGGVACGKSTVLAMFAARGAHTIRADEVAHELMQPGTAVYVKVVATFGREILDADGSIDRRKLAEAAFPERIKELNGIVHPAVIAEQDRWANEFNGREPEAVAIVEAALIFEAGANKRMDKMITVTCTPQQKAMRFAVRARLSLEAARREVERRMAAQIPEEEKAARSDYVIDNSGSTFETERQVERVWRELAVVRQR